MRRLVLATCFALAAALLLATPGAARPPFGGPGRDHGPARMIQEHAEELGLTAETQAAIDEIVDGTHAQAEDLHTQLRELRRAKHALLEQDEPDLEAALALVEEAGLVEIQLHQLKLRAMLAIRQTLTPEQRQKLVELREEFRSQWRHPMEACEPDAERLCAEAGDRHSLGRCLEQHGDEVTAECRQALECGPFRGHHGHHGRGLVAE